ncbi:MAG: DUF4411 family protein, partial [Candidatus Latescibacteria bacterium]|nr:DUF4411 family protein [Candidatus Latescibacterota bacterium]NIO78448.1 DUF4411 family protein [Candidatus Latescibacterota bacterium]
MDDTVFTLDANVFIEAARRYYAFDLAPKFWDSLLHHAQNDRIRSIDHVRKELERGKDELAKWAGGVFADEFASTDEEDVVKFYADVMNWVQSHEQFSDAAKADFAGSADGWLVAYARVRGCIVVTHELPAPDARRKIPIPSVC